MTFDPMKPFDLSDFSCRDGVHCIREGRDVCECGERPRKAFTDPWAWNASESLRREAAIDAQFAAGRQS